MFRANQNSQKKRNMLLNPIEDVQKGEWYDLQKWGLKWNFLSTVTVTKAGACTLCMPRHVPKLSLINALLINLNVANMQLAIR